MNNEGRFFFKFLRSLVRTKYHRETGQRYPVNSQSPEEKTIYTSYQLPLYQGPESTQNSNAIPLEVTDFCRPGQMGFPAQC